MKALALLFACCSAFAQVDPCTGQASTSPVWTQPDLTQPLACDGEAGRTVDFNAKGAIAWRYCLTAGKYAAQVVAAPWADLANTPGMALDLLQAWPSADNATLRALLLKYRTGSFVDPAHAAVWCPFRDRIKAGLPVIAQWVPAGPTLYAFNGTSLAGVVGAAKPGQACDCVKPFKLGTATYCPLQGGPITAVARCKKP